MADNLFDMFKMDNLPSERVGEPENEQGKVEDTPETGFKEIDPNNISDELEDELISKQDEEMIDEEEPDEEQISPEMSDDSDEESEFSFSPLVNDLRDNEVLLVDDEDLKDFDPKSMESFKGLVTKSVDKLLQKKLDSIDPTAKRVLELAEKGADIREAFDVTAGLVDFDALDMEDRDNQVGLITDHLMAQGFDEDYIEERISDLEDLDKLDREAAIAAKFLKKQQDESLKAYEKSIENDKLNRQKLYEDEVKEVKKTIDSFDEIAGFKLTKKDKEAFKDYLFKPVTKDGLTQADIDNSTDNKLKKEFMSFKKFAFDKVEKKASTRISKEIEKNLSRYKDSNANSAADFKSRETREGTTIVNLPWLQGNSMFNQ
jgi:hypothetical protein